MNLNMVKMIPVKLGAKATKYAPEALLAVGVGGIIFATVKACKNTPKAEEVLDEFMKAKEEVKSVMNDEKYEEAREKANYGKVAYGKEMAGLYVKYGLKVLRVYAVPLAVGAASLSCIFASHGMLKKRVAGLTAAYTALDGAFRRYRERVVEEYGEEVDKNFKRGIREKEIVIGHKEGKDGTKKEVKEKVKTIDDISLDDVSDYGRWFDAANSTQYRENDPVYNLAFIKGQETVFNNLLHGRGHVFLNEVYDALGFPRTAAGAVTGWVEGNGDNYIDFGIVEHTYRQCNEYNVNDSATFAFSKNDGFYLDFNVDGVILDKI